MLVPPRTKMAVFVGRGPNDGPPQTLEGLAVRLERSDGACRRRVVVAECNDATETPTGTKCRSHIPRGIGRRPRGKRIYPATSTKKTGIGRFLCGGSRIRTGDPMLAKHVLYQLSYTPFSRFFLVVASLDFAPHFVTTARLLLNRRSSALQPLKNKLRTYTKKAGLVSGFSVGPGRVELPTSTLSV